MLAGDGPARLHPRRGVCPSREHSLALGTQALCLPPTWQRPEQKGVPGLMPVLMTQGLGLGSGASSSVPPYRGGNRGTGREGLE